MTRPDPRYGDMMCREAAEVEQRGRRAWAEAARKRMFSLDKAGEETDPRNAKALGVELGERVDK